MNTLKVRKNFIFDKEIIEQTKSILQQKKRNFTEVISLYLEAIAKDPSVIEEIEKKAKKRRGNFIGLLDGQIGDKSYKEFKEEHYENFS